MQLYATERWKILNFIQVLVKIRKLTLGEAYMCEPGRPGIFQRENQLQLNGKTIFNPIKKKNAMLP